MSPRSGLPWNSGAFTEHSSSKMSAFETGRGHKVDHAAVFTTRSSTSAGLNPWWLDGARTVLNDGGWLSLAVPLWNEDQNVSSDTTAFWDGLANILTSNNIASRTVVRLGWEMNLPGWRHAVTSSNRSQWVTKFRAAADRLRTRAPGVKIAFNPNGGSDQTGVAMLALATELKNSFDYAGPDQYNWYPIVNNDSAWSQMYNAGPGGMKAWEDWCRANGKGYTIPEWGGYPGSSAGRGSDGSFYAAKMIGRFRALAAEGIPVFEAYFNESASYIANSLWSPQQMPQLANSYKAALDAAAASGSAPTPTPGPVTASTVSVSATNSDTRAVLSYTVTAGTDGVTGVRVGRDGADSGGYGAYSEDRPLANGTITFDKLVAGRTYNLTATLLPTSLNKSASVSVTVATPPTEPEPEPNPTPPTDAPLVADIPALLAALDVIDAGVSAARAAVAPATPATPEPETPTTPAPTTGTSVRTATGAALATQSWNEVTTNVAVFGSDYGDTDKPRATALLTDVQIPQGATITSAVLRATAGSSPSGSLKARVRAHAVNNAAQLTTASAIRDAVLTTAQSDQWTSTASAWVGDVSSPSLVSVIQEIVSRSGWASGNAILLVATNDGSTGNGYFPSRTVQLTIAYSTTAAPAPTPTPTQPKDTVAPTAGRLTAEASTVSSVTMAWTAPADNVAVARQEIYRGPTPIANVPVGTLRFTDTGLTAGTPYTYRVRFSDAAGNTTDSNTVTRSTASAPSSGGGGSSTRPYLAAADWLWKPIPANPILDSISSATASALNSGTRVLTTVAFGVQVVWEEEITGSTPRYSVNCTSGWGQPFEGHSIPIPNGLVIPGAGDPEWDGHVAIVDRARGYIYNFWRANFSGSSKTASYGAVVPIEGDGRESNGSSTGAGLARIAGIVTEKEMIAGVINHALFFSCNWNAPSSNFRYPAYKSDGSNKGQLPEGARVQLDPAVNVNGLNVPEGVKIIARALQTYGAYCGDNGGARVSMIGEFTGSSVPNGFQSRGITSDYFNLSGIPWSQTRVLRKWDGS